jgi:hypothetical protein
MKLNLLLALLASGLVFSAYHDRLSQQQRHGDPTQAAVASEPLIAIPANEIERIRIRDAQRCIIVHASDQSFIALFERLATARILRRFAPIATDYSPYGLAEPARRLDLFRRRETPPFSILLGSFNPVGNAVYGKRADNTEVLLIGSYFLTTLDFALQQTPAVGDRTCAESDLSLGGLLYLTTYADPD